MAIFFTDETALEYWRWHATTHSVLESPKPSRLSRLPDSSMVVSDIVAAAESFHRSCEPLHVLVRSRNQIRRTDDVCFHLHFGELPYKSCYSLNRGLYVASPEFMFLRMSSRLNLVEQIVLGCEITGQYYICPKDEDIRGFHDCEPLTNASSLQRFLKASGGIKGVNQARRACSYIVENSASPKETELTLLLSLPKHLGGYGLEKPVLNHELLLDDAMKFILKKSYLRTDVLWPSSKVAVEYDSRMCHAGDLKFEEDSERRNVIRALGYDVTTLTLRELNEVTKMDMFSESLARKLGRRMKNEPENYSYRKLKLRTCLSDIMKNNSHNKKCPKIEDGRLEGSY